MGTEITKRATRMVVIRGTRSRRTGLICSDRICCCCQAAMYIVSVYNREKGQNFISFTSWHCISVLLVLKY